VANRVVATARRDDSLADLQRKHGDRLVAPVLDLTDTSGIRAVLASAFRELGRIDVLLSDAGYGLFGGAEEVTDAQIEHQIATNLIGSIQFIRAAIPHLRQQGGGRIVQVSSEGGQIAHPAFSLYHAAKWGIEGFIESAAQDVAPFGIDFIIVEPGPTATNFGAGLVRASPMDIYAVRPQLSPSPGQQAFQRSQTALWAPPPKVVERPESRREVPFLGSGAEKARCGEHPRCSEKPACGARDIG
jgi:NAD(P)-dependent dehydrogenase (short-subunit alcohol dehydrogenase family)